MPGPPTRSCGNVVLGWPPPNQWSGLQTEHSLHSPILNSRQSFHTPPQACHNSHNSQNSDNTRISNPQHRGSLPCFGRPFLGDYKGTLWNTQGFFAAVLENESQKHHYVNKLMADKDLGCFTETHSNRGNIFAYSWHSKILVSRHQPSSRGSSSR